MRSSRVLTSWWFFGSALAVTALVTTSSAAAQKGNQSDATGLPAASSDAVAGAFGPTVTSPVRVLTFASPQVAQAFQQATARLGAQLSSQSFTEANGVRPPAATQNLLFAVMSGGPISIQSANQLAQLLTTGNADPQTVVSAQALSDALRGLLPVGAAVSSKYFNTLAATQLSTANSAYNAFIDASGESFLTSPPPAVAAIRAILIDLNGN